MPLKHDRYFKFPLISPVINTFPEVPTFPARNLVRLREIEFNIFKFLCGDDVYLMKTVHRTENESDFIHEINVLQQCLHPHIIRLIGLDIDEDDKVEAMLTEYVEEALSIRERNSFTLQECKTWSGQIKEAIDYLHKRDLVWGDAKAANVLIKKV